MARPRLELDRKLREIPGPRRIYYSPPSSAKMEYPCIRYTCEGVDVRYADNKIYQDHKQYTLTVIGQKEDEVWNIADRLVETFEYCRVDRPYVADNLNHIVLTLYY